FFLVSLAVGVIGVAGQSHYGVLKSLGQSGVPELLVLSVYGLWFDAAKTLCPAGLAPYYPVPAGFGPGSAPVLVAAFAVSAAAGAAWTLRRRAPALGAGLLYCAAAALPALGAVRFGAQLTSDHFFYLSGIGWGALAAAAFLAAPGGRLRSAAAAAVVAAFALASWNLSYLWRGDLALWTRGAAAYPDAYVPDVNYAHALRSAGREDEAAEYERR